MSDYLMDDIGLRGVVRVLNVAEVLRRAEDLEGECIEELALTEDTVGRFDAEAGLALEV